MKFTTLVLLVVLALSAGAADAAAGGNGNGNQGCGLGNGGSSGTKDCGTVTPIGTQTGAAPITVNTGSTTVNTGPTTVNAPPVTVNQGPVTVNTPPVTVPVTIHNPTSTPNVSAAGGAGGQGGAGGAGGTATSSAQGGYGGYGSGGNATSTNGSVTGHNENGSVTGTNTNGSVTGSSTAAGGQASASAGSSTVTINQQAAKRPAIAPAMGSMASGPCTGAGATLSVGLPGMAGGIGGSTIDRQCTLRNNIALVATFDADLAYRMLDQLEGVREAKEPQEPRQVYAPQLVQVAAGRDADIKRYCDLGVAPDHLCR